MYGNHPLAYAYSIQTFSHYRHCYLCSEIDCFQNLTSPPQWFQPPVIIDVNFLPLCCFCSIIIAILRDREEPKTRKVIHAPASCTPVCSDVGSKSVALIENVKESEDSEIANMVNPGKVKDHTLEKLL